MRQRDEDMFDEMRHAYAQRKRGAARAAMICPLPPLSRAAI